MGSTALIERTPVYGERSAGVGKGSSRIVDEQSDGDRTAVNRQLAAVPGLQRATDLYGAARNRQLAGAGRTDVQLMAG